ncbi:MAG: InlB B-repeat-containing protein, partial [Actinomycetia bacterium]|nr:InlB B-repeat-containing protein [Actinomycetes bacterium]
MRKQKPVSMAFRRVLTVVLAIAMCLGTIVSPQPAAAAGAYTPGMLAMSGASLKVADIYVKPTRPPGALDNTYVASNAQIPLTLTWNVKSTTDPSYSADSVWFGIRVLVPDNEGLSFVVPSWLKSLSDNTQPAPAPVSDGMGHLVLEGQYNYANTALPAGPGSTFSTDIAVKTASGTPDNTTFTPDAQVWLVADSPNGATGSVKASVNNGAAPLPPKITIISSPDYNSNVSPPVNLVTGYYSPSAGKMFTSAAAAQAAGYNDAVYGRVYGASMDVSNAYNTGTEMLDKNVPLTWNSSISVISGWNTASQATITDPAYTPVVIGARLNTYVAGVPTTSIIPGQPTDMTLGGAVPHPNNNGANPAVATPSVTLGPAVGGVVPMQVTMTLNDPTLNNDSFYTSVYVMIFVPLDPTYTDADYNDATTQQRLVIQDTQTTGQSVTGAPINNPNGTTYLSGAQTILPGLPPDPQAGDYSRHVQFDGLPQPVTAYLGEGVSAKAALTTTTNDLAHVYNAANVFMKIDDEAYTPTAVYLDGPYSGSKTILYAAKADGSGWTSLDEMNTTHDNDPKLVYYDSLAALQAAGKTCVGILGELRGGISSPGTVNLSATLSVNKDVNLVSKQYSILEDVRAWAGNALASTTDSYKGTNGGALPALPANNVFMYSDGSESGTSTTYKQPLWNNGARVTQYTSRQEENTYGDTLLIVGYYLNNFRTGNLNGVGAPVDCYLTPANNTTSFNLSRDERIADRYLTFDLVWSGPAGTEPVGGPAMLFGLPVQMSSPYITIIPGTAVLYRNDIGSTLDYSNFIPAYYTPGAAVVDPGTFNGGNTTAAYAQSDPLPGYAGGTMNGFRVNLSGSGTKSGSYTIGYSAYLGDAFNPAKDLPTGTYAQQFEIGGVGATRGLVAFPDASWAGYDPEGMKVGQSGGAIIQVDRDSSSNFRKTAAAAVIDPNGQIDYRTISAASGVALNGYYALDVLPYNGDGRGTSFNGTYIASKATVAVSANTNPSTSLDVYYTTDAAIRTKGASGARPTALDIKNAGPLTDGGTALGVVWHLAVKTVSNGVATYDFGGANPTALVYTGTIAANETPLMDVFLNTSGNKANNVYANDASSYAQDYIDAIPSQIMPVTVVSRSISGTAWIDYVAGNMSGTNENGARDPLEPVLAGLKVRLWQGATEVTADVNGNPYNVTTDATGHYVFNDVPDSATPYRVTFESGTTDISKYLCTWKNKTGADPTLDSDVARVYQADGKTLKEADSDPFTLPALAANANINQQIDAGFLPIPPLTMQNITVMVGKTANGTATTTYLLPDGSTPTFSFTQPVDTNKATLTSAANVATATGVTQGVTPATVSFANSLGDVFTTNYTITVVGALKLMYDGNGNTGGTAPTDPADYASGDGATVQPFGTLARTGYTLKPNWNTAPDGSGTNYAPNAILTMTNNTTLYAQWTPNQYTVHYAPNTLDMDLNLLVGTVSGTTADSTHLYDVAKNLTANGFSIPGYTFIGWNTAANGSGTFYSDTQSVTNLLATNGGEITLYAQWKMAAAYKITYVLNGGSVAGTNPTQYTPADLVANVLPNGHHGYSLINPTKPGYLFDGWTPDAATMASLPQLSLDHNMYVEIPAGTTGDLNFTAAWQPIMYSVRYNPNTVDKSNTPLVGTVSGTMANSQHLFDVAKNLTANAFSIPGYTFVGWNSQPDGSGTSFANLQSVINLKDTDNAVYDVYAQWQISSNLVIYYYDGFVPDGADPLPAYSMQNYGTQVTVAPQPASVPGYTFAGWTTSSPGVTVASGKFAMPANDVVFHGVWTATPYTVNYDTDGGTPATILPMTGVNWAQAGLLPDSNPTKTGYTFTGWNVVDPVGGKAGVTADDPYSLLAGNVDTVRAITLKAQWTPNSYPVTYAYTGMVPAGAPGLPASSMNEFNTQVTVATAPTLPGYTFSGWSTASPGATISAGKFTMPANAVLLTGSWTATRYTVTYNTDGGTPSYPADTSVFWPDTGLTPATPPTKAGYQFVGWDVNTTGGMTGVQSSTPYSQLAGGNDTVMSVELIARWAPASATLYKVQHYKVNSAGVAVLADTETFTGTTDQPTAAVTPKTYVGYTYAP